VSREGAEVTSAGRAFQTRAPATEKAIGSREFALWSVWETWTAGSVE